MSAQLRLTDCTPQLRAPGPASPLRRWLIDTQDMLLDIVGCVGTAGARRNRALAADAEHDTWLVRAAEHIARGENERARYAIAQAQHWDEIEDQHYHGLWSMCAEARDTARRVVIRFEALFRRTR